MKQTLGSIVLCATAGLGVVGCGADAPGDDQEGLQALLHDDALRSVPLGAADAAPAVARRSGVAPSAALISGSPVGVWHFDDCNATRTNLSDATFNNNTAFRSINVGCVAGINDDGFNRQAVQIAAPEDIVYVPDQPNFTFEQGVTVAGWFNPAALGGTKTLFRKRDKDTSSFALLLDAGKFEFVVNLGGGHAINVIAPKKAKAGVFQHVAATYDGTTARLYVDGLEVNNFAIAGAIPPGPGPLLMGNDGSERRYSGAIDDTLFATHALTADQILGLTCFPQQPSMVVTPTRLDLPPGVAGQIDVALTNHNPAACAPLNFSLFTFNFGQDVTIDPAPGTTLAVPPIASGATGHVTVTATPGVNLEPGSFLDVEFEVEEPTTGFFDEGFVGVNVTEPLGCHVSTPRELMIKSTSVVNDAVRTTFTSGSSDARNGVWTFKHLMENLAATPADAPAMVEALLTSFTTPQVINGFTVDPRSGMQSEVLDFWPRTASGALDLARAPLRLQAIVDRFDLRNLDQGDAGELRFVFAFNDPFFTFDALQATMIFEYKLPAATEADVQGWANALHGLGALQFSEPYNAALQAITERVVARNARPDHVNGSALSAVRTNEIAFSDNGIWEQREFHLAASSGRLEQSPLERTPDRSFNSSATLASYITENEAAILAETHVVPAERDGQPFQAGAVFNDLGTWFAPGVSNDARHHFALNTCNGCHAQAETGTFFLQIQPRFAFDESQLSGFLTGITVADPATGEARTFNDLARRNADLKAAVCGAPLTGVALRHGISRVH